MAEHGREGGLDAPTRHPLNQDDPKFWDEDDLNTELERVEEGWKGIAQADASPACVADVINPF